MDALEFLKERDRMCRVYSGKGHCEGCPLKGMHCMTVEPIYDDSYEKVINTVETWSKEHPRKTRQSVFLKQYPNAWTCADGVLSICPNGVTDWHRSAFGTCVGRSKNCVDCRREFWMQEVE